MAIDTSFFFITFLILFKEHFLSPETRQRTKLSLEFNSKLFTIAPTSQFNDKAASLAVLAELLKISTFRFGLNHSTTKFSEQNSLNFFSPSLGAHYEKPFSTKHRFFMLLRHNPLEITNQIASFLNSNTPSYNKYRWNDDGDLIPNANERGDILQRGGGPFHDVDPALRRPFEERIVVGARWHRLGPFSFSAAALGRIVHNNFTVRFDETTAQTYTPVTISDPGGDGRGEDRLAAGAHHLGQQ